MPTRLGIAGGTVAASFASLAMAAPAAADGAEVLHPECGFTAGHFPGIDVEIRAFDCQVVITPNGPVNAVSRARIPEGYPIPVGVTRDEWCVSVVTPSGLINTSCHF